MTQTATAINAAVLSDCQLMAQINMKMSRRLANCTTVTATGRIASHNTFVTTAIAPTMPFRTRSWQSGGAARPTASNAAASQRGY